MIGKPFEAPRPAWNILKRLGQLADGFDADWSRNPAPHNPSPVEAIIAPAPCPPIDDAEKRELDRSLSRREDYEG